MWCFLVLCNNDITLITISITLPFLGGKNITNSLFQLFWNVRYSIKYNHSTVQRNIWSDFSCLTVNMYLLTHLSLHSPLYPSQPPITSLLISTSVKSAFYIPYMYEIILISFWQTKFFVLHGHRLKYQLSYLLAVCLHNESLNLRLLKSVV